LKIDVLKAAILDDEYGKCGSLRLDDSMETPSTGINAVQLALGRL
jgi:hypothetical protein